MSKPNWTDLSLGNKLDALRQLCLESERPNFFPKSLEQFCDWADEARGLKVFSRPILYKDRNKLLRQEAQRLIDVGMHRWTVNGRSEGAYTRELETITKMLASRYHQERQLRLDAQREASALRASVDSLSAKLREVTGLRNVQLVKNKHPEGQ